MKIKEMPHRERPRERMVRLGSQALTTRELLALILDSGYRGKSALDQAGIVMAAFQKLSKIKTCGMGELLEISGIGRARACRLKASLELASRLLQERDEERRKVEGSKDALRLVQPYFLQAEKEKFIILALNAKHRLIRHFVISEGSLVSCPVHPREVFRPLIREGAVAFVAAHNHPSSGDPEPSPEDREITRRLFQIGEVLGIALLDHIIVGRRRYVSLADRGFLEGQKGGGDLILGPFLP